MNRYIVTLIAAACAAAVPAFADDITIDPNPFVSVKTRAQVMDELRAAQKTGSLSYGSGYDPIARWGVTPGPSRTRAEVTAEYISSRAMVAAMSAEDSGSSYLTRVAAAARVRPVTTDLARAD